MCDLPCLLQLLTWLHVSNYRIVISYHINHIISNFIPISYHQNKSKNKTRYWGHDQKAIKAWDNHTLNKSCILYTLTCKNTLYIQTDKNTQEHTRHAPKWNQLYSDSTTDFSWFRKCLVVCNVLQLYSKNSKKKVHNFCICYNLVPYTLV